MAANSKRPAVIVIAGPTASGKSAAAIELAQKLGGEIICADSRTIYRQLSVGVAKPSDADRQKVAHHCLDLADIGGEFNVSDFKLAAQKALAGIKRRGKVAIIAGGSGLYIDALVYDFSFIDKAQPSERSKLDNMDLKQLQQMIVDKKLPMPLNKMNKRHLIRTIETGGRTPKKHKKPDDVIYTAINPGKEQLKRKITARVEHMYAAGFIDELKSLLATYPEELVKSAGIGYSAGVEFLSGELSQNEAKAAFIKGDLALAKRQLTWLKRNPDIVWFESSNKLVASFF